MLAVDDFRGNPIAIGFEDGQLVIGFVGESAVIQVHLLFGLFQESSFL